MFIKWVRRNLIRQSRVSVDAILVKNRWVEGKVKQEYLGYLASIHEDCINLLDPLINFWGKVEKNLERIDLTPQEKKTVETNIQRKIRKPADNEVQEYLELTDRRRQIADRLATNIRSDSHDLMGNHSGGAG